MHYPVKEDFIEGIFIERINRFVARVAIHGKETLVHLANPGRLWEILLKGREVLLLPLKGTKLSYTLWACKKKDIWIPLNTHYTNQVISELILQERLPEFKGFKILRREPAFGEVRFDLLLKSPQGELLALEIKTCTLFGEKGAMFPDAPSKRATRHLLHLSSLPEGIKGAILFAVMSPKVEFFLPAYHIDPEFAEVFLRIYEKIAVFTYGLKWSKDLKRVEEVKPVRLPVSILKRELRNSGSYFLIVYLEKKTYIEKFDAYFSPGYYVYVGSAMKNLRQRIARHARKRKKLKWHIDYLLLNAQLKKVIPIISSEKIECTLAKDILKISEYFVPKFGSSDCTCASHLFYFSKNPLLDETFQDLLVYYRIDRLFEK